nr:MAG TPA: hypothetical protein [Caudoviricetes sp.]
MFFSDILLEFGWETISGINNLFIADIVLHGLRCKRIHKEDIKQ